MARKNPRTVVGLDIEPSHIAAAEATVNGRVTVLRAAVSPLAPGIVRDGEVTDVEALAAALKSFFSAHKLGKRVRLGVANQRIVVRTIDMPPLVGKDLEAAVRFQAQEHLPMPLEQAVLDFQSLGPAVNAAGPKTRVVLVAARREMVDKLVAASRQAGLRLVGIDLSAFAMIRALRVPDAAPDAAVLYMNVGGLTNIAVAQGATCHFTRVILGGFEGLAGELAERRGLTLEHARMWLGHVGVARPLESVEGDEEIAAEARGVLAEGVRRIADEARNTLDFFAAQEGAVPVEGVVLCGAALAVDGFADELSSLVGLPVRAGVVREARPGALGAADAASVAVAAGLAVAEAPA
jgi:type IV pilus assembly protein PilM